MIRAARPLAAILGVAVALATLTACIQNNVSPAQSWLNGQDGVAEASIVFDSTSMFGSSGVVRGELEEGLDGARLDGLVERVLGYLRDNQQVEIRLGIADVDFVVAGDAAAARAQWDDLRRLDDLASALALGADGVRVHVLRPALRQTVDALQGYRSSVEVEGFRTAQEEIDDRRGDDSGPGEHDSGALQILDGEACEPSAEAWSRVLVTAADDAIAQGTVDACGDYLLQYTGETDLTVAAVAWAASQAGSGDPVPTITLTEWDPGYYEIQVTPGDAALFPVMAAFEQPGAPVVRYVLAADGTLELRADEDASAGELLALLTASPLAARLSSISLQGTVAGPVGGESVTALGTLDQLGSLVAEAEALFPLDPAFYQVTIDPASVRIDLYSAPGSDPDMAANAVALRSNPIWTTRDTYVYYMQGYVLISDGVASLGSDTYSRPEPLEAFAEAWNAG